MTERLLVEPLKVHDLADLLGLARTSPDALPPLWHWVATSRWAPIGEIRADGHPQRVASDVPDELTRRMFAGGEVRLLGDIPVGAELEQRTLSTTTELKDGRSGRFALCRVQLEYLLNGEAVIAERQDIVYRPAGVVPDAAPREAPQRQSTGPALRANGSAPRPFRTDPITLMRFSALTSNSHRIHYDWPYATGEEGYPDLVVHGPLMTLACLAALVPAGGSARRIATVRHRNLAPLFCGEAASVVQEPRDDGSGVESTLSKEGGGACVSVSVDWAQD